MAVYELTIPISEEQVRALHVGDTVWLSGVMVTGRDAAHKYMVESFVRSRVIPESERSLYEELRRLLNGGVLYHCGPVVRQLPPPHPPLRGGEEHPPHPPLRGGGAGSSSPPVRPPPFVKRFMSRRSLPILGCAV